MTPITLNQTTTEQFFSPRKVLTNAIYKIAYSFKDKDKITQEIQSAFEKEKEKLVQEDWLKSQYTKIVSKLQGVKTYEEFGNIFIGELCHSIDAQIGTVFTPDYQILDVNTDVSNRASSILKAIGFFGIDKESVASEMKIGEGIIGQCAKDLESRFILEIPQDFVSINTSLGHTRPKCIAIIPIVHEGTLRAILELAFLNNMTEVQKKLLHHVSHNIGVIIQNISQNLLTKNLYNEIEKKNYSLAAQKKALDISAIVAETDLKGRINYVNDKFLEISKYAREELIGQDHRILNSKFHPKDFFKNIWQTISKGHVWKGEIKNKAKDGSFYWVDTTIYPVSDENGQLQKYIAIRFDITERKNIEEKLTLASEKASKAMEIKSNFLANMSHEIRTPLNSVIGLADVLIETPLNDEQRKYVETLRNTGDTLLQIINDILDLSKIESDQSSFENIEFDLDTQAEELTEIMTIKAHEKKLELIVDIDPNVPCRIFGDPLKLRQIMTNLIGNAIKFTSKGHVLFSINLIENNLDERLARIELSVTDTGVGIQEDKINKIFESFTQADSSITRQFGGTGLGLHIVKLLVERMRGKISVVSKFGEGSTFKVEIPFKYNPTCLIKQTNLNYIVQGKNILLIDSFEPTRTVLKKIFSHLEANIEEARNSEEALLKIDSLKKSTDKFFDLIFIDQYLTDMSGLKLISILKKNNYSKSSSFILLLSEYRSNDIQDFIKFGVSAYLTKPVKRSDIEMVLNKIYSGQSKGKLLLVDDEEKILKAVQSLLIPQNLEVQIASDVEAAISILESEAYTFDAIISDLKLPGKSGLELLNHIRSVNSKIPFVIISGCIDDDIRVKAKELDVFEMLEKPYKFQDFIDIIERAVKVGSKYQKEQQSGLSLLQSSPMNILIVDDSIDNQNLIKVYLKNEPHTVHYAENGKEAVTKIMKNNYDLVFMDMQMPIMDGYQATKEIRKWEKDNRKSETRIVALTANALIEEKERTLAAGCSDYLIKPIKKNKFLEYINKSNLKKSI